MKKCLLKVLITIEVFTLIMSVVYAATDVSQENLKSSLQKVFSSNVRIEDKKSDSKEATTYRKPSDLSVKDSSVSLKEEGYSCDMNYLVQDSKVTFSIATNLEASENAGIQENVIIGLNKLILEMGFLSVADVLNVDLDLAATYYNQKLGGSDPTRNVDDSIVKYTFSRSGSEVNSELVVNVEELSSLSSDKIDSSALFTVSFPTDAELDAENEAENSGKEANNEEKKDEQNTSNTNTNNTNNTNTNTNNTNVNTTNTNTNVTGNTNVLKENLPKTGSNFVAKNVCLVIIFVATAILVFMLMYNKRLGMIDKDK